MNTPRPYGYTTVTTSPLNNDNGIDFPCQTGNRADAFEADGASNPMIVGQNNLLNFTGSAVHGGGSCQLSITYDYPPPADKSKWKVIHSYVGGCPASAAGNLEGAVYPNATTDGYGRPYAKTLCTNDDQPECLKSYEFQIPEGMKNGNATLAWTWFNKIGNREMYMNCAPISISGGSDDDTFFDSLPELFVANVPGSDQSECTTAEAGGVIGFPNPGDYVTTGEAITPDAQGTCPAASSSNSTSSSGPSSSAAVSSAAASSSVSTSFSAVQAGKTSAAAQSEATSVESTTLLTMTGYATSTAAAVSSAYATAAATGSYTSSGNSTCSDDTVSCPTPGDVICVGDSQFGLCNIDYCAVPQALAAGTTCSGGVVSRRDVVRRSHRHAAGHLRKRDF